LEYRRIAEVCIACERTVLETAEDWVKINDRLYHARCFNRIEARSAREKR
jgi:hypothetical protein